VEVLTSDGEGRQTTGGGGLGRPAAVLQSISRDEKQLPGRGSTLQSSWRRRLRSTASRRDESKQRPVRAPNSDGGAAQCATARRSRGARRWLGRAWLGRRPYIGAWVAAPALGTHAQARPGGGGHRRGLGLWPMGLAGLTAAHERVGLGLWARPNPVG
jgi:hypothetical protein